MRIIILAGEKTFFSNGATLRLQTLEKYFKNLGNKVDIEHFTPKGKIFPFQYRYLLRANHKNSIQSLMSNYDLAVVADPSLAVLHRMIASKITILDVCDSMIAILKFRSTNESSFTFLKSFISFLYLTYFLRKYSVLTYISSADCQQDRMMNRNMKTAVITNSADISLTEVPPTTGSNDPLIVGFIADLEYPLNRMQYCFILSELLPSILEFGFVLHLFGKKPQDLYVPSGVHHYGFVPNICDVYKAIDISLCPDFYGFGFKNKVQESLLASRPVLTTPLGARGQVLNEGLIVNTTSNEMIFSLSKFQDRNYLRSLSEEMKRENSHSLYIPEDISWLNELLNQDLSE